MPTNRTSYVAGKSHVICLLLPYAVISDVPKDPRASQVIALDLPEGVLPILHPMVMWSVVVDDHQFSNSARGRRGQGFHLKHREFLVHGLTVIAFHHFACSKKHMIGRLFYDV